MSRIRVGLSLKFLLSVSAVIIVTSLFLTVVFIRQQGLQLRTALEERCHTIARNLATNSEYGVLIGSRDVLRQIAAGVVKEQDVVYGVVYDRGGAVLASAETEGREGVRFSAGESFGGIPEAAGGRAGTGIVSTTYSLDSGERIYDVFCPIVSSSRTGEREEIGFWDETPSGRTEVVGVARVGISMARMNRQKRDVTRSVILVTVAVIASAILLSSLMLRRIVTPIRALAIGTRRVASGDLDCHVAIDSNDEIGDLADSFNQMADDLRKYVRELNTEKEGLLDLKMTLEHRTNELEDTLQKMKDIQQELLRSEKFATIGRLAASVAHELRNPLASLKNISFYLQKLGAFTDEKAKRMLEMLSADVRRANQIVTDLLDFSRTKKLNKVPVDLEVFAGQVLEQVSVPEYVRIERKTEPVTATIDPDRVMQVLINLVSNARDAMPDGGTISLSVRREGASAVIQVADTGHGMDAETAARVFEPLFTTKVKGLGLGLAIVKEIIDLHFGRISVASEPGRGTTFTIVLPA